MKLARDPTKEYTSVKIPKSVKQEIDLILKAEDQIDLKNGNFGTKRNISNLVNNFLINYIQQNKKEIGVTNE